MPLPLKKFNPLMGCLLLMAALPLSHAAPYPRNTAVVEAVRKVSPAVVNVSSEYEVRTQSNPFFGFGLNPFFDSFFKDFFDPGLEGRRQKKSLGSGVIIDGKRGFILTNSHVIEKAGKISVVLHDERELETELVGADPDSDLAVLRISSTEPLPSVAMGDSDDLMIGETVIAIGNPFGFSHTVTTGVLSAVKRSIRAEDRVYHDFIQTDASINPGNSGGPLLNINGELIGINTAIYSKAQGIGFAIPINKAKKIVGDLIQHGEVIQAWIGIIVTGLDPSRSRYPGLSGQQGVLVRDVEPKSPAAVAGIRQGDVLVSVGNVAILSNLDYHRVMKDFAPGDSLVLKLWRDGKSFTATVKASLFPEALASELAFRLLGVRTRDGGTEGVMITEIEASSYLARIGVRPGDVIHRLDDAPIRNQSDFEKAVVKFRHKSTLVVLLQRGDQLYHLTVRI